MELLQKVDNRIRRVEADESLFSESYDIIVVGLGTAGTVAAITAARRGMRVLGIERMNAIGGIGSVGAVNGYYFGSKGGFFEELDQKVEEAHGDTYVKFNQFNPDVKKYVLEQEAKKAGVHLRFEASVTGVFLEGNRARGIQWIGPGGLQAAECKVLIDCTGDAEVCSIAGCKTHMGRALDGRTQPFTIVKVYSSNGKIIRTNFDSGCMDQTNAVQLSDALIFSHAQQLENDYPEDYRLMYIAPLAGIREGRLIEGEVQITLADILRDKWTDKLVFYSWADIDKHGKDDALESETFQDWYVASNLGAVNVTVHVPLEVMIPKNFEGMLAAGRCMSFDHDASTCVRMQRDMQKAGEAAAEAACLSIALSVGIRDIPYEELRSILKKSKCLDEANNRGYMFAYPKAPENNRKIQWLTEIDQIKEGLSGDKPGVSIWSSKRLGDQVRGFLREWVKDTGNEMLRKHSAIALGLLMDQAAIPVLRTMVKERDSFVLQDCRKNNQMRGYIAIYLLGKLKDEGIISELRKILLDPGEIERSLYNSNHNTGDFYNDIYFKYFSHSVMALIKIGNALEEKRTEIGKILWEAVEDLKYMYRITGKQPGSYEYSIAENLKNVIKDVLEKW